MLKLAISARDLRFPTRANALISALRAGIPITQRMMAVLAVSGN